MTRTTSPAPIHTLQDFIHAMTGFHLRNEVKPTGAVISTASRLANPGQPSLMGLAIATDPTLQPSQVLFFDNPQHFTRYRSQIRA